jgi:hypothetical protein
MNLQKVTSKETQQVINCKRMSELQDSNSLESYLKYYYYKK